MSSLIFFDYLMLYEDFLELLLTFWYICVVLLMQLQVHVLPREMFGFTTFGIAMLLLKWLPLRAVDKLILFLANLTLGNTDKLGLRRPKTGPIELKNATGKTPVLDTGAISLIKSGNIKVTIQRFLTYIYNLYLNNYLNLFFVIYWNVCRLWNKE